MQSYGECKAKGVPLHVMDEGRKRVLLIAASILAARKLAQYDTEDRVPATIRAIADAIRLGRGDFEVTGQALAGDQVVKKAMADSHTHGEILFEQYLESQGLPFEFEKEHAGRSKRPDYTIEWDGKTIIFDVKD